MGLFTDWLKGPEDNSLEGRKNRLAEARRKAAPIKVMKMEPAGEIETPEQKAANAAAQAREQRLRGFRGLGAGSGSPVTTSTQSNSDSSLEPAQNENPQKPGKPSLDSLLGQIQGGGEQALGQTQSQPVQTRTQVSSQQPQRPLDVDGDGDVDREDVAHILTTLRGQVEGRPRQNAATRRILGRIDHPVAGARIKKFLGAMLDQDRRSRTAQDLSNFSDEDGAVKWLTEGMGLQMGEDGIIRPGDPNRELRALGGAGMPGEGRGEPRAISFREVQALTDPIRMQMLKDAQNDPTGAGARLIHRNALQNDIDWDTATRIYDRMDRSIQTKLDGWGKPEAQQGTFTPMGPVEFLKDADGNFTGETNIDALARTDPEEYAKHFSTENAGNRGRGIFNLMKALSQRGMGEFSGLMGFHDFDTSTPDHIGGRSSGALPNGRFKDDPLNLGFDRRGLNQFKVSSQFEDENGRQRDTLESLLNAAGNVKGALGKVEHDDQDYESMLESPNFMKYLAYRLDQSDFDPDMIERRGGGGGIDQYPDSVQDFMGLDDEVIKRLVSNNSTNNPLGLNMRNMSMLAPRGNQRPLTTNTWGGAPGGGLEFNPLQGYRRAMLASALFDPEIKRQLTEHEERLRANPRMTDARLEREMGKKRRDLVAHNHFGPQKALASLYGMGRLNTQDFIGGLRDLATRRLGFMQGGENQAQYEQLMEQLEDTLVQYQGQLDERMPDGPYQFTEEELMPALNEPYIKAVMGSNFGRSKMPRALIEAFDRINGEVDPEKMYESGPLSLVPNTIL